MSNCISYLKEARGRFLKHECISNHRGIDILRKTELRRILKHVASVSQDGRKAFEREEVKEINNWSALRFFQGYLKCRFRCSTPTSRIVRKFAPRGALVPARRSSREKSLPLENVTSSTYVFVRTRLNVLSMRCDVQCVTQETPTARNDSRGCPIESLSPLITVEGCPKCVLMAMLTRLLYKWYKHTRY